MSPGVDANKNWDERDYEYGNNDLVHSLLIRVNKEERDEANKKEKGE